MNNAPTMPARSAYLDGVDGLRGLAALMVVVYHLFTNSGNPDWRPFFGVNVLRIFHDGWCGVNLFLVLSGFCLFWPFARKETQVLRFKDFMVRRCWRIIPAYYTSLLLVPLGYGILKVCGLRDAPIPLPSGVSDVILHLLLLHSFSVEALRSWNGVAWSLGLEWTWYLFFPIAVCLFRRCGPIRALAILCALNVIYLCGAWWTLGPSNRLSEDLAFAIRTFLPGRLMEFGLGMFVAWWLANRAITRLMTILGIAFAFVLLGFAHLATPVDPMLPVRNTFYGVAFALSLLAVVSPSNNPVRRCCETACMRRTGEWSYSLYLFHMPLVSLVTALLALTGLSGPTRFFLSLLTVPVMVALSRYAYRIVEEPFLQIREKQPIVAPATAVGETV